MMIPLRSLNYWLIFIIILALVLRLVRLDATPPRLTQDELSLGYNALSILETGRDEWGERFPLVFQAFGDYKLPGYIYAAVPFVKVFGLNEWAVRLPSVFAGVFLVWVVYQLTMLLTKEKKVALLSALVMAISPWPIHISRMALESNLGLLFFSLGLLFFIKSWQESSKKYSILAGIFLGLTFYTYIAYRLVVVMVVLSLAIYAFVYHRKKGFDLVGK